MRAHNLFIYLFLLALVHLSIGAPANPLGTIGARSKLPWNSGILPVNRRVEADYPIEFYRGENGRGRLNDIEHVYGWWDDNGGLQVLDWVRPAPVVALVGYVPFPKGSSWAAVVAGQFDTVHFKVGQKIAASRPNVKTVLRLAYEFNGEDMYWRAPADKNQFITGWRRIVDKIRQGAGSKASNVLFSWCVAGLSCASGCYGELYPGDNYVDIVAIDYYDWPANRDTNSWNNEGLRNFNTMLNFAKSHNKQLAIDEWGVHHVVANTYDGDDNPAFINYVFNWVRANKDWIAYEVYFQDDSPTNVDSSLFSGSRDINPLSKAAYLQQMRQTCCSFGGAIAVKYNPNLIGLLGSPTTNELATPDNVGRYNHFQYGSIYWTQATGANFVYGNIKTKWAALNWENGPLGYPITDELTCPDNVGKYNHFQSGSIYWTPSTGAQSIRGIIKNKWVAMGWERSPLGYPTTDENGCPDGVGRYNHFQFGSIYWTPTLGAHEVRGSIKAYWASLGWEAGIGYPISDEYAVSEGRRSDFQRGSLIWTAATGKVRRV